MCITYEQYNLFTLAGLRQSNNGATLYSYFLCIAVLLQEKIAILRENESLIKENEKLRSEKNLLLKNKEAADGQIVVLKKSLEAAQKDLKDRDILVILTSTCCR